MASVQRRPARNVRNGQDARVRSRKRRHTMARSRKRTPWSRRIGPLRAWQWCLAGVLAAGLVLSCAMLVHQTLEDRRTAQIIERNRALARGDAVEAEVHAPVPETTPAAPQQTQEPDPTPTPYAAVTSASAPLTSAGTVDLLALRRKNVDTIGWLTMDSVKAIDFAVVQGRNAFYLNHDFDQKKNAYGTPFLDEGSPLAASPDNLIVYAHNMRNGEMFGELNRVLEDGRFEESPYVHFQTIYGSRTFIPYAVCDISVNPDSTKYLQYYQPYFTGPGQFIDYVYRAERISRVTLPWHAQYGDQLLTLVTCGEEKDDRLVVFLRAIRSSELTTAG